jgi:alpha-tubulin suppressor-like RCC1 family protein
MCSFVTVDIKVFATQGVYTWGSNKCGQLGTGEAKQDMAKPTVVNSLKDSSIVQIDCGAFHTFAVSGRVFPFW